MTTPELQRALVSILPGRRCIWKLHRETDNSLIVFITSPLLRESRWEMVHDNGRPVGLKRKDTTNWLRWSEKTHSWIVASKPDHNLLEGLPLLGTIPY